MGWLAGEVNTLAGSAAPRHPVVTMLNLQRHINAGSHPMEFIQALQAEIVFWQKLIERQANVAPPHVVARMEQSRQSAEQRLSQLTPARRLRVLALVQRG